LVASGIVLIGYTVFNLLAHAFIRDYRPPKWEIVWKHSVFILALPLFAMLVFLGTLPMPALLSFWILVVLFCGLALALYAGSYIAKSYRKSVWAFFDGLGLVPLFVLLPAIGVVLQRPSLPIVLVIVIPVGAICAGVFWFWIMTHVYRRFRQPFPSSFHIVLSGLAISFLVLPLLHYVTSRPGHVRYITASSNFFASNPWIQIAAFLIAVGLATAANRRRIKKKDPSAALLQRLLFVLILLVFGSLAVGSATIGKETDIWLCKDNAWVQQGNPKYEKPFDEECGVIDKAFGIE